MWRGTPPGCGVTARISAKSTQRRATTARRATRSRRLGAGLRPPRPRCRARGHRPGVGKCRVGCGSFRWGYGAINAPHAADAGCKRCRRCSWRRWATFPGPGRPVAAQAGPGEARHAALDGQAVSERGTARARSRAATPRGSAVRGRGRARDGAGAAFRRTSNALAVAAVPRGATRARR